MAAILCSLFISCNSNSQAPRDANGNPVKEADKQDGDKSESEKKMTKRDYSITPATAYNDMFLDSMNMESYISEKKIADSIARRMRSFYNARNYQFAWLSKGGLTEQALAFWNVHNYATYSGDTALINKSLQAKMDGLLTEDKLVINGKDKSMITTELQLTDHFIQYSLGNYEKGYLKRKELERFIPLKKEDAMELADSLLNKKHKDNKYYEDVNESYKLLKEELRKYVEIAKKGGWPQVNVDQKKVKRGSSASGIVQLKKRLQMTGDLAGNDTSALFNDSLELAIKHAQQTFGYKPTGILSVTLIKDLNVLVTVRIKQILINMNRMRWMPVEPEGKLILVNIPEFVLHFFEGKTKAFDMNVVVGKEGHNTMMFTGNLSTVVFSPYWNVPPSIVKKEIMPSMARNPNYLAAQHMEITGQEGGLPVIRQLPGEKNSLGRVKFLFPNSFNIYFHDTPAKGLFNQDKRAYSHGCIRLSDPVKMANYLLKDDASWPADKIEEAMNSGNEKYVKLKDPIPVLITYYTAWVDEKGLINFRDDIYQRDGNVSNKMFIK